MDQKDKGSRISFLPKWNRNWIWSPPYRCHRKVSNLWPIKIKSRWLRYLWIFRRSWTLMAIGQVRGREVKKLEVKKSRFSTRFFNFSHRIKLSEVCLFSAFWQVFGFSPTISISLVASDLSSFSHNFKFSPQIGGFIFGVLTSFSLNFKFSCKIKFVYFWRFDEFFHCIRKYIPSKFMSAEYSSHPNFCLF